MSRVDQGSGRSIPSDAKWVTSLQGGVIPASNVVIMGRGTVQFSLLLSITLRIERGVFLSLSPQTLALQSIEKPFPYILAY